MSGKKQASRAPRRGRCPTGGVRVKRPAPGAVVAVVWVDSGIGEQAPRKRAVKGRAAVLVVAETFGRVVSLGPCERLATKLPEGADSTTLRLAMCSQASGDERSDLAGIWWPSVVEVRVLEGA